MIDKHNLVIDKVKTIVKHHKQLTYAKGELFNIYSILNLKTKEVRTHSAFIAELLNPRGTHLMGNSFLRAFLKLMPESIKDHLDVETVSASIEFFIGVIDKKSKTGGRIDVLLVDNNGNTLCIENKIDAGDQEEQIERYCNYNNKKNQVIYLSKYGNGPNITSKGDLVSEIDFHIISYQKEIIEWLEICQTIAHDQPILRESIKQYKILIQKVTKTLGDKQNKELAQVVANNLEEASLIAVKYNQVVTEIKNNFRNKILEILKTEITGYNIVSNKDVKSPYANLWFHNEICDQKERWFAIESFSGLGHIDGGFFIGIHDKKANGLDKNYNPINKRWVHHEIITYENELINLSDTSFLQKINTVVQLENVAKDVSKKIIDFVIKNGHLLKN